MGAVFLGGMRRVSGVSGFIPLQLRTWVLPHSDGFRNEVSGLKNSDRFQKFSDDFEVHVRKIFFLFWGNESILKRNSCILY